MLIIHQFVIEAEQDEDHLEATVHAAEYVWNRPNQEQDRRHAFEPPVSERDPVDVFFGFA